MEYLRISSISRRIFASGLSLSTATQFRMSESAIGVGEIVLIASVILVVIRLLIQDNTYFSKDYRPFLYFWVSAIVLLPFGYYVSVEEGVVSANAGHDVLAWILVLVVLITSLSCFSALEIAKILRLTMMITIIALFAMFLLHFLREQLLGNFDVMYGPRFRGWAMNPNQIAFQLSAIPFFLMFYIRNIERSMFLYMLLVLTILLGISTQSDALNLAWVISGILILFLYVSRGTIVPRRFSERFLVFLCYILLPLIVVFSVLILNTESFMNIGEGDIPLEFMGFYTEVSQPMKRVLLWTNGIEVIRESPWVGYGPGPHSGLNGPFYDEESHNTFIDWGTSAGLLGLFVYSYLLGAILKKIIQSGYITLVAAYSSILCVSMFHNILRHPVYWFYLAAIIGLVNCCRGKKYLSVRTI